MVAAHVEAIVVSPRHHMLDIRHIGIEDATALRQRARALLRPLAHALTCRAEGVAGEEGAGNGHAVRP